MMLRKTVNNYITSAGIRAVLTGFKEKFAVELAVVGAVLGCVRLQVIVNFRRAVVEARPTEYIWLLILLAIEVRLFIIRPLLLVFVHLVGGKGIYYAVKIKVQVFRVKLVQGLKLI